jgi:hypothetical protein
MEHDSKIAGKIKAQITRFSSRLTEGLKKPDRKFIREVIYGIQASKDVKLSNIARSLGETIPLIKTEWRLSRNASKEDFTDEMNTRLIRFGKTRIKDDTVLALDPGDIDKPYAKKMECLALVRDGSTKETRSPGYWTMEVVGADVEGEELVPLYGELYSQDAKGFVSENAQIMKAVDAVASHVDRKGIWTIDRGGDRKRLLAGFLERLLRFVIRMNGDRHVVHEGVTKSMEEVAASCPCPHIRTIEIEKDGTRQKKTLSLGSATVYLPWHPIPLTLVVMKGYGVSPLMLLTNLDVSIRGVNWVLEIYLTRWKCEESYRFIKQGYNLEDIRVLGYTSLRNLMVMVQAVFFFVSVELGRKLKLNILLKKVYEKAKRFFEIPQFKQYAIADGIYRLLFGQKAAFQDKDSPSTNQLPFSFILLE